MRVRLLLLHSTNAVSVSDELTSVLIQVQLTFQQDAAAAATDDGDGGELVMMMMMKMSGILVSTSMPMSP